MARVRIPSAAADSPAAKAVATVLEDLFARVGPDIKAKLVAAYRNQAKGVFDMILEHAEKSENQGRIEFAMIRWQDAIEFDREAAMAAWDRKWRRTGTSQLPQAAYKEMPPDHIAWWKDVRAYREFLSVSYEHADKQAIQDYEYARDSFVWKNVKKIANVMGPRADFVGAQTSFKLRSGMFEGKLNVDFGAGWFKAAVGLKYVVRTTPRVTPYFQYPLLFTEALVDGRHVKGPSEEELRILLGGGARPSREEELAAGGFCPGSGRPADPDAYARIANRMGKYLGCPICKAVVNVTGAKYRKHMAPSAQRAAQAQRLTTEGYCPKSREKVSEAVVQAMPPVPGYKDPKVICEHCGQPARLDARKEWIREGLAEGEYPKEMKVLSAIYYKHRLPT